MTRRFAGYAALFDRPDRGGDIIRKGAFQGAKADLPLLWGHDARQRIGTICHLAEDDKGLRIIAQSDGRSVRIGQGLSFGYRVQQAQRSGCGAYRELTRIDLLEISLVAHPMQPLARVIAIQDPDPPQETKHGL
jgi:HK97 family phage prohead protease